uniref:Uncharacterized protein n=1 Tax=Anguilla anguilla TaxID=7936 RepID=A0A0E9RJN4_ANGAN
MFLNALCAGCIVGDCSLHLLINLNLNACSNLTFSKQFGKRKFSLHKKNKSKNRTRNKNITSCMF